MYTVKDMNFLDKYGIDVNKVSNLEAALTHSSYSNEHGGTNYERLEFLGDAVLELVTSEYFFGTNKYKEGEMTKIRSRYVCEHALYEYSKTVGFIPYIKVGNGQIHDVNETIIADVFEAILGAIFLDYGYEASKKYVLEIITPFIESGTMFYSDYKSLLQELVQTDKKSLEYRLVKESGPAHDKRYVVEVIINDMVFGTGSGKSKKEAEQKAAFDAYKKSVK